ncbi:protein activator of alkane oxidation PraB [uncultured Brevundimonas sp.]|uniref:protein activator of alkane oxidation PraB n=1 Tax=uncultured Brevundimonas sp. TaxID=213418 RepID=UPI00261EFBF2|nr:protein activator of alkane oxidation PraB [uncultured Brevundimonas sp.]
MKRIIATAAAAATLLAAAAPAMAGTSVTPAPSTFTLSGTVTVSQSVTLNCNLSLNVSVDSAGNAKITGGGLSAGDTLCPSVVLSNFDWPISATAPATPGPATQLTIANFRATALSGRCAGNLVVSWNNTTKVATIATTVPGTNLIGQSKPCSITGTLRPSNNSVSINVT